ncbi:bacterial regulatory s, gntR family protein [Acinetobacter baumannii 1457504]|nr:bacterial regulatory s, gntR family protein [Acinetobacter baumannii 1457504]
MLDETAFKNFKLPRYEKVRWELQKLLIQSKWTVEEPIPSEQELAQMYSVSVGTVRKAVEGLVEDGLLVKKQGKGTFLKQPNFENSLIRFLDYVIKKASSFSHKDKLKK